MKKSVLSLAIAASAAGIASVSHADMYINSKGIGEALVYPMYSAQNGNDTYVHIVNTMDQAKAVKVRIIEAQNSKEVLDFNLYMSPEDHFSFAVTATEDGGAELRTIDNSCTVPAIPDADGDGVKSVAFRNTLYLTDKVAATTSTAAIDNTSIARTQVGYIEVIEMGQIDENATAVVDTALTNKKNVFAAVKHDENGMPADCSIVVDAWSDLGATDGKWLADSKATATADKGASEFLTSWSGGGLYGFGTVINVADGTAFGFDAVAIDSAVEAGAAGYALHYKPGDTRPDFTDAALDEVAAVEVDGAIQRADFTKPIVVDGNEVLAVAALFQTYELANDYVVDPAINANTDWVITAPTKTFHVKSTPTITPFSVAWNKQTACEPVGINSWDREEAYTPDAPGLPDFSPAPPPVDNSADLNLCYETTVLQFGDESATNSETVVTGIGSIVNYTEGWARISFDPAVLTDAGKAKIGTHNRVIAPTTSGPALQGLPVTGFAVQRYTNSGANEAGALANYSGAFQHKTTQLVTSTI